VALYTLVTLLSSATVRKPLRPVGLVIAKAGSMIFRETPHPALSFHNSDMLAYVSTKLCERDWNAGEVLASDTT